MALFAEIRSLLRLLADGIPCPTTAILSCKDEMVSVKSVEIFENAKGVNVILLPDSHHYHYSEEDRIVISDAFKRFLERLN